MYIIWYKGLGAHGRPGGRQKPIECVQWTQRGTGHHPCAMETPQHHICSPNRALRDSLDSKPVKQSTSIIERQSK